MAFVSANPYSAGSVIHTSSGGSTHGGSGSSFGTGVVGQSISGQHSRSSNDVGYYENISAKSAVSSANPLDLVYQMRDYNNDFNVAQTEMVNAYNAREAQKNRDWQERMARNAHQYEVEDLLKAGLNPVLSAGGQGAYVGTGAAASGQKAVADNTASNAALSLLNNALNSAGSVASAALEAGDDKKFWQTWDFWKTIIPTGGHIIGQIIRALS